MTGELRPRRPSFWAWLFLAGPVIWYTHFWVVYLAAEWGCQVVGDFLILGRSGVAVVTVALTVAGVGLTVWYMVRAWQRRGRGEPSDQPGEFSRAGLILGLIFAMGILFVGVPALVLTPC
jgi:hypothetical protein